MKFEPPSSRARAFHKLRIFDIAAAAICPPLSLLLRDPGIFFYDGWYTLVLYCLIGFVATLAIFQLFGVGRAIDRFGSVEETADLWKAAIGSAALSSAIFFTLTRLDDVPRSAPLLHLILLGALLSVERAMAIRQAHAPARLVAAANGGAGAIVYGANRLAWFYIRMLDSIPGSDRVLAIVDDNARHHGREFCGRAIVGSIENLRSIVTEYRTHGVTISHVIVARQSAARGARLAEIEALCADAGVNCVALPDRLALGVGDTNSTTPARELAATPTARPYWRVKRVVDVMAAACLGIVLLPITALVALVLIFDVGSPVVFWQYRLGLNGRAFKIYKFRTMRAPFDSRGAPVPEERRLSTIGSFMRRTRLDELPQLWNILIGDMAFIGPRPLLPIDQPRSASRRLAAPPGITGWAQVHGGKLIDAEEKAALDEWYVDHASFPLDLRIAIRTGVMMILGDQRDENVVAQALGDLRQREDVVSAAP
jgi:lipopolysaccharide/colanic/teichoic acid biosynthesis glycosyltransferase